MAATLLGSCPQVTRQVKANPQSTASRLSRIFPWCIPSTQKKSQPNLNHHNIQRTHYRTEQPLELSIAKGAHQD